MIPVQDLKFERRAGGPAEALKFGLGLTSTGSKMT